MRETKDFSYYEYEVGRYEPFCMATDEEKKNFKPYKEDKSKLVWNVFVEEFNAKKIVPVNLFEYNWIFLRDGLLYAKKHYANDYSKFANHIQSLLRHEYWSRCEYETVICGWPGSHLKQEDLNELQEELDRTQKHFEELGWTNAVATVNTPYPQPAFKIDVYTQVMMNWDRFIDYVWNNKHLITIKKLGLENIVKATKKK